MFQNFIDEIVNHNPSFQTFLTSERNIGKYLKFEIKNINQSFLLYTTVEKLLLIEDFDNHQEDVFVSGDLVSFLKLAKYQKVNPAILNDLGVTIEGDLGLIQRLSDAIRNSSVKNIVEANLSSIIGDVASGQASNIFENLKDEFSKSTQSMAKQANYIKSRYTDENNSNVLRQDDAGYKQFLNELKEQTTAIHELEHLVAELKKQINSKL